VEHIGLERIHEAIQRYWSARLMTSVRLTVKTNG
jgi:hypothetical protein